MKKILLITIALLIYQNLNSQVLINNSKPITLGGNNTEKSDKSKKVKHINNVKKKNFEGLDFNALKNDIEEIKKDDPTYSPLAIGIGKQLDILKEGDWEQFDDGSKICRLKLHIENSLSLIVAFDKFYLPRGSELYIFDSDGKFVMGPFNSNNNKESGKYMTGLLPGPDLIIEYYENGNIKKKAELVIFEIGVGISIDALNKIDVEDKDNKKEKLQLSMPPVPYNLYESDWLITDSQDTIYLGKPASCEVGAAIDNIKRAICQYIVLQIYNHKGKKTIGFIHKTAVSIGSLDTNDCNVYLFTVKHVVGDDLIKNIISSEDFSTVRYNWIRKPHIPNPPCQYPPSYTDAEWATTIELSEVVDYCGTIILVIDKDNDIALLKLKSKPIHDLYLSGWNVNPTYASTTAYVMSNNGPMRFSNGILDNNYQDPNSNSCSISNVFNIYFKKGVSGATVFEKVGTNYRVIGSIFDGTVHNGVLTKISAGYLREYDNQLMDYLNPDTIPKIFNGRNYFPSSCDSSQCCEHYFADFKGNPPDTVSNWRITANQQTNMCCTYLVIEERVDTNITCSDYLIDILINDSLEYQNILVNFNDYPEKIYSLPQCILLEPNELWRKNRYKIVFKDLDTNIINVCEKELVFQCSKPCVINDTSYNIIVQPQRFDTLTETCCYEAIIIRKDSNACDVNAIFPYILQNKYPWNHNYTESFAYVQDSTLFESSDTCIIRDICLKTGEYQGIYFYFYQDVDFNPDSTPIDYWYNQWIYYTDVYSIPGFCSKCCGSYDIIRHFDSVNCELYYEIVNNDTIDCKFDSVSIDAYFRTNDGEYTFISHIGDGIGDSIYLDKSKIIQKITSNNFQMYYRFTFYDSSSHVICYNEIDPPLCEDVGLLNYYYPTIPGSSFYGCCTNIQIGANNYPDSLNFKIFRNEYDPIIGEIIAVQYPKDTTYRHRSTIKICADNEKTSFIVVYYDDNNNIIAKIPLFAYNCTCCNEDSLEFNVIGPDNDCCYSFTLINNKIVNTCDSVTNYQATKVGETEREIWGYVHGGLGLHIKEICNESDSTEQYYFEFFSDNTYSDSSKVCTRLVALDPCIDTAAVCCEQIKFEVFLEKGVGGCADSLCFVTENWTIPDAKYDCFNHFVNSDGDTSEFNPLQPPDLISDTCLPQGTIIDGTIYLLRSLGDTVPCPIHYQAYCPIADIRQGCNPDTCNNDWKFPDEPLFQKIDTGACKGCYLNIDYKFRNSCGGWQDLQITKIEKYNPNIDSLTCNCSAEEIYQLAVQMVIAKNKMDFEPTSDDIKEGRDSCNIQWRVSQVSCWAEYNWSPWMQKMEKDKKPHIQDIDPNQEYHWSSTIFETCNDDCCARQFMVCRYDDSTVSIQDLGLLSGVNNCDTVFAPPPRFALPCYFTCDFLDSISTIYHGKSPEINNPEIKQLFGFEPINETIRSKFEVYYDQLNFKVMVENTEESTIQIDFYNLLGGLVLTESGKLNRGLNTYQLSLSNVYTGLYVYSISINGISLITGKMNIIK